LLRPYYQFSNVIKENHDIEEAIRFRPGVARCARPIRAGNGAEYLTIQHHDDDTESTFRSDAEHHYDDYTGSGSFAADYSDYRYHHQVQAPQGEAVRDENHHNHAAGRSGEADRHDDHHYNTGARASAEGNHNYNDHTRTPAAIVERTPP
jgi:hypothetical protein